jgi:CBS domain-containing protein
MVIALSSSVLKEKPMAQHVREVMTPNPHTVTQKDSIADAARIMAREDTGVVPVVDGLTIVGLITDRDIVVRLIAEGRDTSGATVNEAMTKSVRTVKEDTPVSEVMELMSSAQVRRVPVVNNSNELVGIVSLADLATETRSDNKVGQTVENISEGKGNN